MTPTSTLRSEGSKVNEQLVAEHLRRNDMRTARHVKRVQEGGTGVLAAAEAEAKPVALEQRVQDLALAYSKRPDRETLVDLVLEGQRLLLRERLK